VGKIKGERKKEKDVSQKKYLAQTSTPGGEKE